MYVKGGASGGHHQDKGTSQSYHSQKILGIKIVVIETLYCEVLGNFIKNNGMSRAKITLYLC